MPYAGCVGLLAANNSEVSVTKTKKPRHGGTANGVKQGWYIMWSGMMERCRNPNRSRYNRYGGRGIKVCEEWQDPIKFKEWAMQQEWPESHSIDRIDSDGDYCPENCRIITVSENSKKTKRSKLSDADAENVKKVLASGVSYTKAAKMFGVSKSCIWSIKHGMSHVSQETRMKNVLERLENPRDSHGRKINKV